jgi:hypothetical protein
MEKDERCGRFHLIAVGLGGEKEKRGNSALSITLEVC